MSATGGKGRKPNHMRLVKSYSEKERQSFPIKYEGKKDTTGVTPRLGMCRRVVRRIR